MLQALPSVETREIILLLYKTAERMTSKPLCIMITRPMYNQRPPVQVRPVALIKADQLRSGVRQPLLLYVESIYANDYTQIRSDNFVPPSACFSTFTIYPFISRFFIVGQSPLVFYHSAIQFQTAFSGLDQLVLRRRNAIIGSKSNSYFTCTLRKSYHFMCSNLHCVFIIAYVI